MEFTPDQKFAGLFPGFMPIFVIGAARSGTSVLCDALRLGAGLPGNREGFLMSVGYLLMTTLDRAWQTLGPGLQRLADGGRGDPAQERALTKFDADELLRDVLRHFHRLAVPESGSVWVDKTPDIYMVHATPILAAAYPAARWVWVQRNGVEVVDSRRRSHHGMSFEESCRDWAMVVGDWQRVRPMLGDRCLELDQRDIALRGAETAAKLGAFLGLGAAATCAMERVFSEHQPGRTTRRGYDEILTLDAAAWPAAQKETFRRICGRSMQAAGYSV
jgi:hypothetical protein